MDRPEREFSKSLPRDLRRRQTRTEAILWKAVRNRKLSGLKFRRQHPIERVIADFYCAEFRLIVEVDGSIHETEEQHNSDLLRDDWLESQGYTIIRFKNQEIDQNLTTVLKRIVDTTKSLSHTGEAGSSKARTG